MTALDIDPYAFAKASGWEGQIVPFPGEGEEHFRTVTVRGETITLLVAQGLGGYYVPVNNKGQILVRAPQVGDLLHYLPDVLGWVDNPCKLRPEALLTPGWAKTWPGRYTEQNLREAEERRAAREAKATTSAAPAPAAPASAQVAPVKAKVSFGSPSPSSPSPAFDVDSGPFSAESAIDMHDTGVVQPPSAQVTAPPAPAAPAQFTAPPAPAQVAPVKAKVSFGSPSPASPAAPAPAATAPTSPPVLDPVVDETGLLFLRRAEITWGQWFQEVLAFADGNGNPSLIAHGLAAGLPLVRPTDPNRVEFRKSKFTAPLGRPPGS